ncbi:HD-GYP domain-containing protein [soil metagenome]
MDRKSLIYVCVVIAVTTAFTLLYLPLSELAALTAADWWALFVFIGIGVLAQAAAIDFGSGRQATSSLAFIPLLATSMVLPPASSLVAAGVVIGVSEFAFFRRSVVKAAFNISQVVLAVGLSAVTYTWILGSEPRANISAIGAIAVVCVFFSANLILSSAGLALYRDQPFWPTFRDVVGPRGGNLLYDMLSSPFVIMTVAVYVSVGIWGVLMLILPLLLLRHSYASRQKLEHSNRDLLHALVKAIETRDPYTSGHSIRVATLAKLIAEDLGLTARKVNRVRTAALLHDIGKIDPAFSAVLLKPYDLTPDERELIQTHSSKGADLLRDMGSMEKEVVSAVRHHHERYDGRGYPDGLKQEEIPLEARIIMMSDSIDAMLSDRPYRAALSVPQVKRELDRCKGSQFDPSLVETVIKANTLEKAVQLVADWRHEEGSSQPMLAVLP